METSTVSLACVDGRLLAIKSYARAALQPRHCLNLRRELCVLAHLRQCGVPGVVQLLHAEEAPDAVRLYFEAAAGGDLYRGLRRGPYNEARLRDEASGPRVVAPLLQVLASLHALGYVHRDIKPENIFFGADGGLVLGDFGLAIDQRRERPISRVGTLDYMAPEVLAQPCAEEAAAVPPGWLASYNEKADVWSVGVLVFECLTGAAPFAHPSPAVAALKARFQDAPPLPAGASAACRDFVRAALCQDPRRRASAAALLQHPWLRAAPAAAAAAALAKRAAAAPAAPAPPAPPAAVAIPAAAFVPEAHAAAAYDSAAFRRSASLPVTVGLPGAAAAPASCDGVFVLSDDDECLGPSTWDAAPPPPAAPARAPCSGALATEAAALSGGSPLPGERPPSMGVGLTGADPAGAPPAAPPPGSAARPPRGGAGAGRHGPAETLLRQHSLPAELGDADCGWGAAARAAAPRAGGPSAPGSPYGAAAGPGRALHLQAWARAAAAAQRRRCAAACGGDAPERSPFAEAPRARGGSPCPRELDTVSELHAAPPTPPPPPAFAPRAAPTATGGAPGSPGGASDASGSSSLARRSSGDSCSSDCGPPPVFGAAASPPRCRSRGGAAGAAPPSPAAALLQGWVQSLLQRGRPLRAGGKGVHGAAPHLYAPRPDGLASSAGPYPATNVTCWGNNQLTVPTLTAGEAVVPGSDYACAYTTVECWGSTSFSAATVPGTLGAAVAAGEYFSCALEVAGTVKCWGSNDFDKSTVPTNLGTVIQVDRLAGPDAWPAAGTWITGLGVRTATGATVELRMRKDVEHAVVPDGNKTRALPPKGVPTGAAGLRALLDTVVVNGEDVLGSVGSGNTLDLGNRHLVHFPATTHAGDAADGPVVVVETPDMSTTWYLESEDTWHLNFKVTLKAGNRIRAMHGLLGQSLHWTPGTEPVVEGGDDLAYVVRDGLLGAEFKYSLFGRRNTDDARRALKVSAHGGLAGGTPAALLALDGVDV
ncbi:MAG: hypothetical protein J3K34DRAFT_525156 [Monoraphidium minutum]|nr:MAG: hypothetical protein J3K34DRAFT_525156 [Monoraphidium minutum]